jgi:hypothetical protein
VGFLSSDGARDTSGKAKWITSGEHCRPQPFNSFAMQVEIYLAKAPVGQAKADALRESLV